MAERQSKIHALESLAKATKVTIDGKAYELRFTHGAYIEAETITGISTLTEADKYFTKPSRRTLSAAFYALLSAAGAAQTLDEVQKLVSAEKNAAAVYDAVLAAHSLARVEAEEAVPTVTTGA